MFNNGKLVKTLLSQLDKIADKKTKAWWENYVKHNTVFRGVGIPQIREEVARWYKNEQLDKLPLDDQLDLALSFFEEKYAEDKLAGVLFLQNYLYDKFDWELLVSRFDEVFNGGFIYDWNVCDWFCVRVLGPLIKKNGIPCAKAISSWHSKNNVWQARSSLVAFANLAKENQYTPLLMRSSLKLIKREERFAKTAVGWILRELSKADKNRVINFIEGNRQYFSRESLENAVKYFSPAEKRKIRQ